ncbi:Pentatricopeptide repeat [Macleaya cordata]|uniref:Pentatricopeptide repeat n=1 Tax=Macleaya cordata TaxID=56857 RepID=A0A200PRA0_MACCD|nr:Pentatricopeptide repeat [Macleaya cordata]
MTLYMPIFRHCTTPRTLTQLHAHLLISGFQRNALASTKLIETYAKMGNLESAQLVFNSFSTPDSFMWGVLIKNYVWSLFFKEAISLYHEMLYKQTQFCSFIFPSLLKACSGLADVGLGRKIHGRIIKSGFESDQVVETTLLCMYGERGSLDSARKLFDKMPVRDLVSWSSMISNYVRNEKAHEGLEIFRQMILEGIRIDSVTMLSITDACAELGFQKLAKSVHCYILRKKIQSNGSLENSVIVMYNKCGALESAELMFKQLSHRTTVSCTAMISCYNQQAQFREALNIFIEMQESEVEPNSVTMMGILFSCSQLGWIREGKSIHGFVIRKSLDPKFDLLGLSLIDMYASYGKLENCQIIFAFIQEKNLILWNSIISVYTRNGLSEEALKYFAQLHMEGLLPDSFTLASSLSSCGAIGFSKLGSQIHGNIAKTGLGSNEFVHNSLIDMYSKCGSVDSAYMKFKEMEPKSVITWNSMINGFALNGNSVEAISLLDQMYFKGIMMDKVTFLSAIQACSHLGDLEKGKFFHNKLIIYGLEKDSYVDSALVNMYSKCGDLRMAGRIFNSLLERSVVTWSAMIAGYGIHGHVEAAISLFQEMVNSGIKPNEVTFMSMLSACSHGGFVGEGKFYFNLMKDFDIEPKLEHYVYMVDLLSRAGDIESAFEFIKSMPIPPSASIWGALLNGCRIHRRMDMIESIEKNILGLEPDNSGYYVLLSNTYAEGGNLDEFRKLRSAMKDVGLRKAPGYSTIETNGRIYRFGAGDTSHSQMKDVYRLLDDLKSLAEEQGYLLESDSSIDGDDKEFKRNSVQSHSERLAIAFGIINTSPGTTLRVSKNLRVCVDCHTFAKFVSKITSREIIMRDLNRFHHFANGSCSCRDYW